MNKKALIGFGILAVLAIGSITDRGKERAPPPLPPTATLPRSTPPPPPAAIQPPERQVLGQPAPLPIATAPAQRTLYTTTAVRLRASPSTGARIVSTVQPGRTVVSFGTDGAWHQVSTENETGWMHGDYLSATRPASRPPPAPAPVAPAYQPAPLVRQQPAPSRRAGEPVRSPYVGTCECPYDLMRNGRRCGGRSAYSRPGGRSPTCYH